MQLKMGREKTEKEENIKSPLLYRQCMGAIDYLHNKTKFERLGGKGLNKGHSKGFSSRLPLAQNTDFLYTLLFLFLNKRANCMQLLQKESHGATHCNKQTI